VRNAAHELRTPLALVLGYSEMLATGDFGELTAAQQTAIDVVAQRANKLHLMVGDMSLLLEAAHSDLEPVPVDLSAVLSHVVSEYQSKARLAGLDLTTRIQGDLPAVMADPVQIYRVFEHLLSNAVKFTPSGGSISLTSARHNGHVEVHVADTGVGISEAEQERIFTRFYQVDGRSNRKYPGMGLGLALVRETVESLGGDVAVESREGRGSRFRVKLPVHLEEATEAASEAGEPTLVEQQPSDVGRGGQRWAVKA